MEKIYFGIDVSKDTFDTKLPGGVKKFDNSEKGFNEFITQLNPQAHCVMEATGPYYMRLAYYLNERGIFVSVINPLVIKRFAQMRMVRAKTDKADAILITEYANLEHPPLWNPPVRFINEIQQENMVLDGLIKQRTAIKNQKEALNHMPYISGKALSTLDHILEELENQIKELEESIAKKTKKECSNMLEVLKSIPGIGIKTAIQLIIITQGFSRFETSKQLSAYVGISPRIFQSGTIKGKTRICKMGMGKMRALLYLCSWSAINCNKACKELYERLLAKGKAKKLALIAVANKLLKQAFAIGTRLEYYVETK
jgi:transposase